MTREIDVVISIEPFGRHERFQAVDLTLVIGLQRRVVRIKLQAGFCIFQFLDQVGLESFLGHRKADRDIALIHRSAFRNGACAVIPVIER